MDDELRAFHSSAPSYEDRPTWLWNAEDDLFDRIITHDEYKAIQYRARLVFESAARDIKERLPVVKALAVPEPPKSPAPTNRSTKDTDHELLTGLALFVVACSIICWLLRMYS